MGSKLAEFFAGRGHQVTVMDNLVRRGSETNVARLRKLGINFVHGDIRNREDFRGLPGRVDCVIECSAQPSVVSGYTNPILDFRTNVEGALNCLEFCAQGSAGMIFLSSSRVYPAIKINSLPRVELATRWDWDQQAPRELFPPGADPVWGISAGFSTDGPTKTIYGATKAAADYLCQEYADAFNAPVIVNRCGVIAGEGQFGVENQGWLTYWAICCCLGRRINFFGHNGKQVRDILFIEDLCRLVELQLVRLFESRRAQPCEFLGDVWNVGGGRENSLSLIEATDLMQRLFEKEAPVTYKDKARRGDMVIYITDNRPVSQQMEWSPQVALETGVERIVRWVKDNRDMLVDAGL